MRKKIYTLSLGLSLFVALPVMATTVSQTDKVTSSDGVAYDGFGYETAIDGDIMVIGAQDKGLETGSVYVYERDADGIWSETAVLTASDGRSLDDFGSSVAVSGSTIVVGAYRDDDWGANSGSVYIFEKDGGGTWTEVEKLIASDGASGDYFGSSVSLSGELIVVGAYGEDSSGLRESGAVYIFKYDTVTETWSENEKLTASDGADSDYFGYSVGISGNYVVVGARGDDDDGSNSGSAYIYEYDSDADTWSEIEKLTASDAYAGDVFGYSVAISGTTVVIGAYGNDDDGSGSGSAYVFDYDSGTWTETAILTASDAEAQDVFGWDVAIDDDVIVIGAPWEDENGSEAGAAYVFLNSDGTWSEVTKIISDDGATKDYFGTSLAVSGDTLVVGAYADDDLGTYSGSAYIFDITRDETVVYYLDADGDGYGSTTPATDTYATESEANEAGYVSNSDDCHDDDPYAYPGAEEIMNDDTTPGVDEYDNNCDGELDDGSGTGTTIPAPPFASFLKGHTFKK